MKYSLLICPLVIYVHTLYFLAGPYIIYMLKDVEIIEDWTAIKKVRDMLGLKKKVCFG